MSKADDLRSQLIRSFATPDASWSTFKREPHYESEGVRLARGTAAKKLGMSVDIVPPGKRACPYHFHYAEEEAFIVLEGSGTLQTGGRIDNIKETDLTSLGAGISHTGTHAGGVTQRVVPGDVFVVPAGMAHRFSQLDGPIRYVVYRFEPGK